MTAVAAVAVAEYGPAGEDLDGAAGGVFGLALVFGLGNIALGVRSRRRVFALVVGFAVGAGLLSLACGVPGPTSLAVATTVLAAGSFLAFTSVFSVWLLNAVYGLDEARETRTLLAVAGERLRFGRDLHDVIGRNLTVIALKSELAVQLAQRERPEAVAQMVEVQRPAHEAQREVVRGGARLPRGRPRRGTRGRAGRADRRRHRLRGHRTGGRTARAGAVRARLGGAGGGHERPAARGRPVLHGGTPGTRGARGADGGERRGAPGRRPGAGVRGGGPGWSGYASGRRRSGTLRAGPAGDGLFLLTAEIPLPAHSGEAPPAVSAAVPTPLPPSEATP